jgi:hypothetical protein
MIAMALYGGILAGLAVLFAGGVSALREAVRQKARPRGFLMAIGVIAGSLMGLWAMLV